MITVEKKRHSPSRSAGIRLAALLAFYLPVIPAAGQMGEEPIEEVGKKEYRRSCAACHGEGGRGDGPLAELLIVRPLDLTSIRKRHGGEFPASLVYRIIDGRNEMPSHGVREMPIWGDRYRAEALRGLPLPLDVGADAIVHGRILSLIYYLESIQED